MLEITENMWKKIKEKRNISINMVTPPILYDALLLKSHKCPSRCSSGQKCLPGRTNGEKCPLRCFPSGRIASVWMLLQLKSWGKCPLGSLPSGQKCDAVPFQQLFQRKYVRFNVCWCFSSRQNWIKVPTWVHFQEKLQTKHPQNSLSNSATLF